MWKSEGQVWASLGFGFFILLAFSDVISIFSPMKLWKRHLDKSSWAPAGKNGLKL